MKQGLPSTDIGVAEVTVSASAPFLACGELYAQKGEDMVREEHWQHLERANRELALCLERLRKVRATGNVQEIQQAETAYFQALQWVYDTAQNAVAEGVRH